MAKLFNEVVRFVIVGCMAAATHWTVAIACVENLHISPLLANVAGWIVAFFVSFGGHYRWTFRHQPKFPLRALRRFFLVSAGGFGLNEFSYAVLLHETRLPYDVLLAVILIALAVLTFVISRLWAFRHTREAS